MRSRARNFVFAFLFSCLTCGALWAQVTAQISGTVKDASGAVLPGVEVTATQTATGLVRTAVSNETGSYIVPNLPVGPPRRAPPDLPPTKARSKNVVAAV